MSFTIFTLFLSSLLFQLSHLYFLKTCKEYKAGLKRINQISQKVKKYFFVIVLHIVTTFFSSFSPQIYRLKVIKRNVGILAIRLSIELYASIIQGKFHRNWPSGVSGYVILNN